MIVPCGESAPLHFVMTGHGRGDFVQNFVNAVSGDIWEGNIIMDRITVETLDMYDVILVAANTQQLDFIASLPKELKHAKVIFLEGGSADDINVMPLEYRAKMIDACRAVDMVITWQDWAEDLYGLWTDKPVRMVGTPVPTNLILQYYCPPEERGPRFAAIGVHIGIGGAADRNGLVSCLAVQKAYPDLPMHIPYSHDQEEVFIRKYIPKGIPCKVIGQEDYWRNVLSKAWIGVILDQRFTFGRFSDNCACLGVPCIGVAGSGTQEFLWPKLTVQNPFKEVSKIIYKIEEMDSSFMYNEVCSTAWQNVQRIFSEEATAERFYAAVKELGVER
jgi:hypothetical protein